MKKIILFMGLAVISVLGMFQATYAEPTPAPAAQTESTVIVQKSEPVSPQPQVEAKEEPTTQPAETVVQPTPEPVAVTPAGSHDDWLAAAGITEVYWANVLIGKENASWDPCKMNGGAVDCTYTGDRAYGIPQALPGSKMASAGSDWQTNPITQLKWMKSYVEGRYGSFEAAVAFHQRNNWY